MQVFQDVQTSVEPNQINHFKGTHGMVQPQFKSLVDILRAGDALLEHVEGFVADHGINPAGDKARGFFDDNNFFPHAAAYIGYRGQGIVVGFERAHHFEQLHFVYRVEEVHANTLLRAVGNAGNFGDAERRRIRSEDCRRTANFVEKSEDLNLRFHLLGNRLDDEIGLTRRLLDRPGVLEASERRIRRARADFPEFNSLVQVGADFSFRLTQGVRKKVFENGTIAANRCRMGNSTAHDAGADHGDGFDVRHYLPPTSSCSSTVTKLGSDLRMYSERRLRSSTVIDGKPTVMRRSVAAMSST